MPKRRIGLFGGTFNPIHLGHLKAAKIVRGRFGLTTVLFIPSFLPPHKSAGNIASSEDRFRMVKLAIKTQPGFIPSPIEIEAREKSYSFITLEKVGQQYPSSWLFFILGVDAYLEIKTWKSYREVLRQCLFIVMSRPGYDLEKARRLLKNEEDVRVTEVSGEGPVPDSLFFEFNVFLAPIDALDISSTEIREKIRKGEPIAGLVPPPVGEYIQEKRLYQE